MEEEYYDELFDLKPIIIPEIYSIHPSHTAHEITGKNPNSSSSVSSSSQLISFENMNIYSENTPFDDQFKPDHYRDHHANLSSPTILNFSSPVKDYRSSNHNDQGDIDLANEKNPNYRESMQYHHLMSERRRREKLAQLFITLSKALPAVKKLDKASILEHAIDCIKGLEERISILEKEQSTYKSSTNASNNTYDSSFEESSNNGSTNEPSEISVTISNKTVFVKICCKKSKGIMSRIYSEMEKMNLCGIDLRVMPFGDTKLDITILAQMESEFCSTGNDIVDNLKMALLDQFDMQD